MSSKNFSSLAVMTAISGRLITQSSAPRDNGFGEVHELIEHVMGEPVLTHAIPRVAGEIKDRLLSQFPNAQDLIALIITDCENKQVKKAQQRVIDALGPTLSVS